MVSPEIGMDHDDGLEVCRKDEIGDDGEPAFPVYTTPPDQTALIAELQQEIKRAYEMLSVWGVSKERAKSLSNGIDVLGSRFVKGANLDAENLSRQKTVIQEKTDEIATLQNQVTNLINSEEAWCKGYKELEADAKRYRWICNHANVINEKFLPKTEICCQFLNNTDWLNFKIDQAIATKKKSSWDNFVMPAGGSSEDIRKSSDDLRESVAKDLERISSIGNDDEHE
jgi:hypothetical protein